jgi:hypothetical protein
MIPDFLCGRSQAYVTQTCVRFSPSFLAEQGLRPPWLGVLSVCAIFNNTFVVSTGRVMVSSQEVPCARMENIVIE